MSRHHRLNYGFLSQKVYEMAQLQKAGHRIVLITSGAVAAGMEVRNLSQRPTDTLQLQMLSGMGQVKLIKYYREFFQEQGEFIAQVLVTHHNFQTKGEISTVQAVLNAYLEAGIIPIINENDLVDKAEIEASPVFSDNDMLSGVVATELKVDLALILTDVDGLFADNPKTNHAAAFYEQVDCITPEMLRNADHGKSNLGLGGMLSKVKAAQLITDAGIPCIIGNGNKPIERLIDGSEKRTYFAPRLPLSP